MVSVLSGLFNADMKTLIHSAIKVLYEYVKAPDSLIKYGEKVEKPLNEVVNEIVSVGFKVEGALKKKK